MRIFRYYLFLGWLALANGFLCQFVWDHTHSIALLLLGWVCSGLSGWQMGRMEESNA